MSSAGSELELHQAVTAAPHGVKATGPARHAGRTCSLPSLSATNAIRRSNEMYSEYDQTSDLTIRFVVKLKNLIVFIVGGGWARRSAAMGFVEVPWLGWVRMRRSFGGPSLCENARAGSGFKSAVASEQQGF